MKDEQFFGWSRPVELLARPITLPSWPKPKGTWMQQRLIDIKRFPWPRTAQERKDDFRFSEHLIEHNTHVDDCEWCEAMKEQGNGDK